jgi:hypothetical protein
VADRHPTHHFDLRQAACEGLAEGLREHLPGAVGIVAKGIPLCTLGTLTHLIVGVSVPGSAISVVLAGVGSWAWLRTRRNQCSELPPDPESFTR